MEYTFSTSATAESPAKAIKLGWYLRLIDLMSRSAALSGAEEEIRFNRDTEQPVQPLPCSQMTFGPAGLANTSFRCPKSVAVNPRVAAEAPQNFKKSRRDTFIFYSSFPFFSELILKSVFLGAGKHNGRLLKDCSLLSDN
jgi:hypothetical protein